LLLAALVGLGISELGTSDSGAPSSTMRTEAASVIVPGGAPKPAPAVKHSRRPATPHGTPSYTWTSPAGQQSTSSSSTSGATTGSPTRTTVRSTITSSPTPSLSPTHGKGKAKGAGNGRHKPSKH
jgi:hypothetical protein